MGLMENQPQSPYMVPAAIVVAGLLIAGAMVYNGGSSSSNNVGNNAPAESGLPTPVEVAKAIGLDKGDFEKCIARDGPSRIVEEQALAAQRAGGAGTPYSVIVSADGTMFPVSGAFPLEDNPTSGLLGFRTAIEAALSGNNQAAIDFFIDQAQTEVGEVEPVSETDHIRGSLDAKVKIIEYSDLECPFCATLHPTLQQIMEDFDGDVAWIYRHFPLDFHPSARPLAIGSECAAQLGGNDKFWEYIDYVFAA